MCGIAGFASEQGIRDPDSLLQEMASRLAHRGPDGRGVYGHAGAGLASSRLAIVDPTGGDQPARSEDASVWAVLNGEIYNHRALRDDLAARGHRFTSQSDTEVLVHLYEEYGLEMLPRIEGIYGLAVWDDQRRRLLLA
ncbi:asparagine synthetase B, partial [bacterium]|nr:asparagine synthetase B [candidate division CSSED10-310 bacterium]